MPLKFIGKSFFALLSFVIVSHAAYHFLTRKPKKKKPKKEINDLIVFCDGDDQLRKSKYSRCMITKSVERLLYYLSLPQHNLDICMYVLTNADITYALLKLHYRGVKIRVITDADMAFTTGSGVHRLRKQGIPIRWMKSTNLMHHKFCVIDSLTQDSRVTPFVMTGSLNWTNQALSGNYEDYVVLSQKELVEKYKEHFERLWVLFAPIV